MEISPEEQAELNEKIKVFFEMNDPIIKSEKSTYAFSDLEIFEENVLKLTPDRLISMDIHSRSDIVAIIGCDRKGTVGLIVKVNKDFCAIKIDFSFSFSLSMI